MGDTHNFELVLQQFSNRRQNTLYSVCKQQKQFNIKPEEVISSVSSQIKAIQTSELKFERCDKRSNKKYSNSKFLSVNNLPTYRELPATKFDTQCVSDTQLIDLIENAENIHQKGITQEFETSFHHKDKPEVNKNIECNLNSETIDSINRRNPSNAKAKERDKDISPSSINVTDKYSENLFEESIVIQEEIDKNYNKKTDKFDENNTDIDEEINDIDNVERDGASPILNHCIAEESEIFERPISPIFVHKNSKQKSSTPSPLIFNLEKFEQFENLVIPLIETNDFKTVKTVIDSQIINKELHINMNKELKIQVNEQNIESLSPSIVVGTAKGASKVDEENQSEVLKDEILFSSDEESYKEDLPFTCALETSFYDQSGVLDKTVYVGFQTASNKSIIVDKESFVKARSILSDINAGVSVTELVNNCDNFVKDENIDTEVSKTEKEGNETHAEFTNTAGKSNETDNLNFKAISSENNVLLGNATDMNKGHANNQRHLFQGFVTANNKAIKLSDKGLARCKKVFQDIDLEKSFDNNKYLDDVDNATNYYDGVSKGIDVVTDDTEGLFINKDISNEYNTVIQVKEVINTDLNATLDLQNFISDTQMVDDALIKELENIEMSLQDKQDNNNKAKNDVKEGNKTVDKVSSISKYIFKDAEVLEENGGISKKNTALEFKGFQTASNKNISISKNVLETSRNLFQDLDIIDFVKDAEKSKENHIDMCDHRSTGNAGIGFKTASNKGIHISNNALLKVKNIFKDVESEEFRLPLKNKVLSKTYPTEDISDQSAIIDKIVGFKTASNKNIDVSKQALHKVKHIFKDIDNFPREIENDDLFICSKYKKIENKNPYPDVTESLSNENIATDKDINQGNIPIKLALLKQSLKSVENRSSESKSFIKSAFMGFKTANNKKVPVTFESLEKTKYIFKDIDSVQNTDSNEETDTSVEDAKEKHLKTSKHKEKNPQAITRKSAFKGFHTASNKMISISEESLIQSKAIFKDLNLVDDVSITKDETQTASDKIQIVPNKLDTKKHFLGFKTANNTNILISDAALTKTKDIFKDIDSPNFQLPNKINVPKEILPAKVDDVNRCSTSKTSFVGFKTGNNKVIKVSDAALAKTKAIFQEIVPLDLEIPQNKRNYYPNIEKTSDNTKLSNETAKSHTFQGFQTANNKQVEISADALAKAKDIFKDLDKVEDINNKPTACRNDLKDDNNAELEINRKLSPVFKGFATASNKKVLISEDSLAKAKKLHDSEINEKIVGLNDNNSNNQEIASKDNLGKAKRLFSELNASKTVDTHKRTKSENKEAIENIIDTQVLNDFEESLHTDDFKQTPKQSKRSGSPILSCPRAKKRKKFEIPYSQNKVIAPYKVEIEESETTVNIFDVNYKKVKKYTLKDLLNVSKGADKTTDTYIKQFDYTNLLNFEFDGNRNNVTASKITVPELKEMFLKNVNKKLVPNGWFENHIRLILWKLISYEIKFQFGIVCDVKNVLGQLKYRYDNELYDAKRPALRKIMEKDDLPSKTMILCVAEIYMDDVSVASVTNLQGNIELSLTDGWYCIRTIIDKLLAKLVFDGKICIGTKLVTTGAELVNCDQGVSPWEDTSSIRLKIFGNSTRRARWDARLGYHGNGAILSRLSHIALSGGKVAKLRVLVTRVYPPLYVDKFEDGSTVTRSERLEHIHQAKVEAERQKIMERIYEEVEKEFADQESQDSEELSDSGAKRTCLDSGSQISKLMKRTKDPGEFKTTLTTSQTTLLDNYTSKKRDQLLEDIQNRMRQKMEKEGVCVKRNVVMLLKIRVADVMEKSGVEVVKGIMSIWKPTDAVLDIIKEGTWIDVMNVIPTSQRYSEIQLSAGRQTIFNSSKYKETEKIKPVINLLKRKSYIIKDLAQNPQMITDYNEIDTAGIIFLIDPTIEEFDSSKHQFQNIYLADENKNIICINFWGGLTKYGYQNVLDTGQVIFCGNLQKRAGNTRKSIPHYRVTELSYFTKTPKYEGARILVGDLNKKFMSLDRRKFCEDCVVLKNNYSNFKQNTENMSPCRFNTSDLNVSKNRMFIDSPLLKQCKKDDNFNLTGLDFESTFKQTDSQQLSEELLERKKKVNAKIAKLKRYGEPPPLSPLHIINRSKNATSSYKSPLPNENSSQAQNAVQNSVQSKSDSCINVASVKNTPNNCDNDVPCSPILNRTYVKNVNPVKINFDVKDNNDSRIDYFEDDFDGSPPLSLD